MRTDIASAGVTRYTVRKAAAIVVGVAAAAVAFSALFASLGSHHASGTRRTVTAAPREALPGLLVWLSRLLRCGAGSA